MVTGARLPYPPTRSVHPEARYKLELERARRRGGCKSRVQTTYDMIALDEKCPDSSHKSASHRESWFSRISPVIRRSLKLKMAGLHPAARHTDEGPKSAAGRTPSNVLEGCGANRSSVTPMPVPSGRSRGGPPHLTARRWRSGGQWVEHLRQAALRTARQRRAPPRVRTCT